MKHMLRLALLAFLAMSGYANADNPFVRNWTLNPTRSTPDKMVVERAGGNTYIFNFGGGPEKIVVDGTDQPSRLYGGDTLSVGVQGESWKVIRKSGGRPMLSAIWSVSKDGGTLTDRYTAFNADGATYIQIYTYQRKAPGAGFAGTWVSTNVEAVNFVLGIQIRPFEREGLSIIDPSSQIMGNMNFGPSLVRTLDEHTLELMRKKSDGELSGFLQLVLSPDLKSLVITHNGTAGEPQIFAFDRRLHGQAAA